MSLESKMTSTDYKNKTRKEPGFYNMYSLEKCGLVKKLAWLQNII